MKLYVCRMLQKSSRASVRTFDARGCIGPSSRRKLEREGCRKRMFDVVNSSHSSYSSSSSLFSSFAAGKREGSPWSRAKCSGPNTNLARSTRNGCS